MKEIVELIGVFGLAWIIFAVGCHRDPQQEAANFDAQEAESTAQYWAKTEADDLDRYRIVVQDKNGTHDQRCEMILILRQDYLDAKDEANTRKWSQLLKEQCGET